MLTILKKIIAVVMIIWKYLKKPLICDKDILQHFSKQKTEEEWMDDPLGMKFEPHEEIIHQTIPELDDLKVRVEKLEGIHKPMEIDEEHPYGGCYCHKDSICDHLKQIICRVELLEGTPVDMKITTHEEAVRQ